MARKGSPAGGGRRPGVPGRRTDDRFSVLFGADRVETLVPLLRERGLDVGCRHPVFRYDKDGVHFCALVRGDRLDALTQKRPWRAEVVANQTELSKKVFSHVIKANPFRDRKSLPEGMGKLV